MAKATNGIDVRVYQRGGRKTVKDLFAQATKFMCNELMTQDEQAGLTVKVKRVHCRNALAKGYDGLAHGMGFDGFRANTDESITDLQGEVASVVRGEAGQAKDQTVSIRRKRWFSDSDCRDIYLRHQLETLAHELMHVAQRVSGRMEHLLAGEGTANYGSFGYEPGSRNNALWIRFNGEAKLLPEYASCTDNPEAVWPEYFDQPWEVEARSVEKDLTDRFLKTIGIDTADSGGRAALENRHDADGMDD